MQVERSCLAIVQHSLKQKIKNKRLKTIQNFLLENFDKNFYFLYFIFDFECRTVVRHDSGKRVSNTLVTYLRDGHNPPKGGLIADENAGTYVIRI